MTAYKRYRDVGIVIILLAVPFFFLRANMKRPENLNGLDRAVLRISAPIEFAASSLARGVSNLWESYVYLVDVKADNERLAYENARLREQNHRLEQKETENRELRRLLQLRESLPGDLVSAQVIGKDFTEFFRVTRVVLDRGSRNIRPNMPVVSPDGVVGKVLRVAGDTIDLQLSVDAAFGIDVIDERTQARGFVRGTGDPAKYSC
ncbi:MAG: rod shape-determining protein MreC, partial [Myxococcales bacterium]|nr:rod shape-determining protein MreC [Myxococcales bacterium]